MRIAVRAGQPGRLARPAAVSAVARAAELLGYSTVWVRGGAALDPIVVLSAIAGFTTRVRLGVGVEVTESASSVVLAKALSTLDVLSEGRLSVSLGSGSLGTGEGASVDETLDVLEATWSASTLTDGAARLMQRPHPPLLLVANTRSQLDRVARRGDGWNPDGVPVDCLAGMWAEVRDLAAAHRRDPDTLQLVVRADVVLTDRAAAGDRPIYHGTVEQVADDVDATRRVGAHEIVLGLVGDPSLDEALDAYARVAEAADLRAPAV
jgi:alkanesulfonate monooxygenase SsuD/methylene tetrahydromethanopterin reductase-like flavin-dependent oxidoreductase (luciferase family)